MQGRKFDSEKLKYNLMPVGVLEQEVRVLMNGAEKYAIDNWKYVEDWKRRYIEATKRHIAAYESGEEFDDGEGGDGLHHLAHARCCLAFLLWKSTNRTIYIAGPMRGYANNNFHEFFKFESMLAYNNWIVFNPARMSYELCMALEKNLDEISYGEYLKQDLETIKNKCSALFMLDGWQYSEGANEEFKLANELGLTIYYENGLIIPKPPIGAIV
jgi:hypothetical protein